MSTTWAFLGILAGREFGIAFAEWDFNIFCNAGKMSLKELFMATVGLGISIVLLLIQNPN